MAAPPTTTAFKSKYLALTLEKSGALKVERPGGTLETDLKTVKTAAMNVATAATTVVTDVGLENCLKVGIAGTAIVVAAAAIYKKWPWMKTVNVKENNVLELEVAEAKEDLFDTLVKNDKIKAHLEVSFEDLDSNLEEILGAEVYSRVGQDIIKKLEGVQISSVTSVDGSSDSQHVVGRIFQNANVNVTHEDQIQVVVGDQAVGLKVLGGTFVEHAKGGVMAVGNIRKEDLEAIARLKREMKAGGTSKPKK